MKKKITAGQVLMTALAMSREDRRDLVDILAESMDLVAVRKKRGRKALPPEGPENSPSPEPTRVAQQTDAPIDAEACTRAFLEWCATNGVDPAAIQTKSRGPVATAYRQKVAVFLYARGFSSTSIGWATRRDRTSINKILTDLGKKPGGVLTL